MEQTHQELHGCQWPCGKVEGTAFGLLATNGESCQLALVDELATLQVHCVVHQPEMTLGPPFERALLNRRYLSKPISEGEE